MGEIYNFDDRVQYEKLNCQVYTVELKQESFKNKLENIEWIKFESDDFELKLQSSWECIRTKQPFAYGMMKAVYLMKKRNNNQEIYVVKFQLRKAFTKVLQCSQ
ncbi:unnamed protein product [Paramecium sonneborni]|uniref:Uncharacterized protein n=1 Tax=Paramecium sonneborni TaxID=65129 RepID=A0A8S1P4J2_9CILI|nr:unnamed protein product [Paramecium sonneborni]